MVRARVAEQLVWGVPFAFLAFMLGVPLLSVAGAALFSRGNLDFSTLTSVLSDTYFLKVAQLTVVQALWSTLASVALGLVWAFVLVRYTFPFKRTLRSLTIVPFVLPAVSLALGFVIVFGQQGLLNRTLMAAFRLSQPPLHLLYSLQAIVLAHAFYNAPIVARLTHAAWERLDPSYEQSARALGANALRAFLSVTLRLLSPAVFTGAALAFVYSFLSFPIVLTLGGARFATLEVAIYTESITLRHLDTGAALALVQLVLSLGFTYGYLWLERRFAQRLETTQARKTVPLFVPGWRPLRWTLWALLAVGGLFFLSPLLGVVVDSLRAPNGAWTTAWYGKIFAPDFNAFIGSSPLASVGNSLVFALGTTGLSLLLGVPLAWGIVKRDLGWLNPLAMLPLAVSSVALGFGLLRAFSSPPLVWLDRGVAVVLAHALLALPFVVRALVPVLRGLDPGLSEAARGLGASRAQALFQVELPLLRTALLAGAAFAFAISIGEMSATLMLAKPGLATMPVAVYHFLGARLFGAASAMSVLLIVFTGLAFVWIERAGERVI